MIEQYKKEVSQIVASETFQQQLIHAMAEKQQTKHDVNWRPVIIYLCIFFLCPFIHLSISIYLSTSGTAASARS